MISAIKEICIFMMIAQAILLLVPGNSYMKYVRVLVGILMILMIARPIFALFMGEEGEKAFQEQLKAFESSLAEAQGNSDGFRIQEEDSLGIYRTVEEEVKQMQEEVKQTPEEAKQMQEKEGVQQIPEEKTQAGNEKIEIAPVTIKEEERAE